MIDVLVYVVVFLLGFIFGSLITENSYLKGRRKGDK